MEHHNVLFFQVPINVCVFIIHLNHISGPLWWCWGVSFFPSSSCIIYIQERLIRYSCCKSCRNLLIRIFWCIDDIFLIDILFVSYLKPKHILVWKNNMSIFFLASEYCSNNYLTLKWFSRYKYYYLSYWWGGRFIHFTKIICTQVNIANSTGIGRLISDCFSQISPLNGIK